MDKGDKRSAILRAALELFAEKGFHGAPTSLLAERAGVGVGTIYRYFKDKDELIRELYRELHTEARLQVFVEIRADLPVRDRYLRLMERLLRYLLANTAVFQFMEQYYFSPYFREDDCEPPEEHEDLTRLLLKARDEGIVKDAPLFVLKALAFGPISSLAKEKIYRDQAVDEVVIRQTIEASWDGLRNVSGS